MFLTIGRAYGHEFSASTGVHFPLEHLLSRGKEATKLLFDKLNQESVRGNSPNYIHIVSVMISSDWQGSTNACIHTVKDE